MISIILVQYRNEDLTRAALNSLQQTQRGDHEIILIDNGSPGFDVTRMQADFPGVRVIAGERNEGFARANNRAASFAKGEILLFLNNDTLCHEDVCIAIEAEFSMRRDMGIAGPRLTNADGSFQLSAGWLPSFWREIADKAVYGMLGKKIRIVEQWLEKRYARRRNVGWVTGAALFIRKDLFGRLGGFDEQMFMYFEDKDICARAWKAGMKVVFDPIVTITHLKGGSSSDSSGFLSGVYRDSQRRYYAMHRNFLERILLWLYLRGKRN